MRWRDIPMNPPIQTLRWFGLFCVLLLTGLSGWHYLQSQNVLAPVNLILAGVIGLTVLLRPAWLRPVFVGALIVTYPIGWLVSHVVLFVLFFGVFTPMALFFRLIGRDALALRIRPDLNSYWTEKPAASDVRSYFRQS